MGEAFVGAPEVDAEFRRMLEFVLHPLPPPTQIWQEE